MKIPNTSHLRPTHGLNIALLTDTYLQKLNGSANTLGRKVAVMPLPGYPQAKSSLPAKGQMEAVLLNQVRTHGDKYVSAKRVTATN